MAVPNHLVLLRQRASPASRSRFQSRAESPGSLTVAASTSQHSAFQSRVKSPGTLTSNCIICRIWCFRAVPNHLVLLPPGDFLCHKPRFRATPNHLVLLQRRSSATKGRCFRALLNHLVLLRVRAHASHHYVLEPCRITWFSYRLDHCAGLVQFQSRAGLSGSPSLPHQYTHPHTGTRATTAKDSPRASASPTPFAPTRADPVASSASNAGSPPAVPAPFGRERIGQGRFPVHMAGSLPPRSSFDRPTC